MLNAEAIRRKYELMREAMSERTRRLWAGTEALALGHGGIAIVQRATGLSRPTIARWMREAQSPPAMGRDRSRVPGGGRKRTDELDPTLRESLERLLDPVCRGDPESPLRWTCKSTRRLAEELEGLDHKVGKSVVSELLRDMGYSLQANKKTREGTRHPDRNAQFEHINAVVKARQAAGDPAISVDTKKKARPSGR